MLAVMLLMSLADAERAFAEGLAQRERGERGAEAFRRAAAGFDEARRDGVESAALYRNLGNAYLLAGDLPRAIASYRRGLRLAPSDKELRESLAFAREQVVYTDKLGRPRDDGWPVIDPRLVFPGAAFMYFVGCLALTRGRVVRRRRRWALLGVSLILVALAGAYLGRPPPDEPFVVVARDGVLLRKGDGESFPAWFETPLNRGVEAKLLYRRGAWVQVELAGGEVGWVAARDLIECDAQ